MMLHSRNDSNLFWEKFKTRIRNRWQQLDDEDIDGFKDNFDSLSLNIQRKCHESRAVVQNFVDSLWFEIYVREASTIFKGRSLSERPGKAFSS